MKMNNNNTEKHREREKEVTILDLITSRLEHAQYARRFVFVFQKKNQKEGR